jgi:hypothetical protein
MTNIYNEDHQNCLDRDKESLCQEISRLNSKLSYVENVLSEIHLLNSMGKSLKIHDALNAAIDVIK